MSLSTEDLKKIKHSLQQELIELQADQQAASDSMQTVELDQSRQGRLSRMDAMQSQAMAQELER